MHIPHNLTGTQMQLIWRCGLNSAPPIHILTDNKQRFSNLSIVHYQEYLEKGQDLPSTLVIIAKGSKEEGPYLFWWATNKDRPELMTEVERQIRELNSSLNMEQYEICQMSIGNSVF